MVTLRSLFLLFVFISTLLSFTSCGRKADAPDTPPFTTLAGSLGSASRQPIELDDVASAAAPTGVDAALFERLREALVKQLEAQGKGTSAPPTGEANLLDDITFFDNGGGDWTITWTYKNRGDYDQNGEVNVADLTTIGQNFRATTASPNWATAQVADGDKNGEVNLADVTSIGQYYRGQVGGYNVYGGPEQTGPWTLVGTVDRTSGNFGAYPAQFEFHLGTANDAWYLIVPRDFFGEDNVDGGGGGGDPQQPAVVDLGDTTTPDNTATIGSGGGSIEGTPGGPLDGVKVTFPPGAFEVDSQVTLGTNNGTVTPALGEHSGTILDLSVTPTSEFLAPARITVPLDGTGRLPVPYYIEPTTGQLQFCTPRGFDEGAGTMTFETWHASPYTWIWADPPGTTQNHDGDFDSKSGTQTVGFRPSADGFVLNNTGPNTYYPEGRCAGFTYWANWYYRNKKTQFGQFNPQYADPVGGNFGGTTREQIIASRAYTSCLGSWTEQGINLAGDLLSDSCTYGWIRNAIANTGQPVEMRIQTSYWNGGWGAHAVSAYRANNGTLHIYDPNRPGDDGAVITLDTFLWDTFNDYVHGGNTYVSFWSNGNGSIPLREPYENLWKDVQNYFSDSTKSKITITSHTSGSDCPDRNPLIQGTLTSAEVLVDEIEITVSNNKSVQTVKGDVNQTGNFAVYVPLQKGENMLKFRTFGHTGSEWKRVEITNDQENKEFKLNGTFSTAVILITLTWNNATDVDLYVTDPTNATSWYSSKVTPDGGVLDVDNTTARGPEHWTLLEENTVRWGQNYTVGVHYYSDKDSTADVPVSGNVHVLMYEDTPKQFSYDVPFSLSGANNENKAPGSTGADWFYLPPITPFAP